MAVFQASGGTPFEPRRPNENIDRLNAFVNVLGQGLAGQQQGQARQQQQDLIKQQRESQILKDLLTRSQTDATSALSEQRRTPKPPDILKELKQKIAAPLFAEREAGTITPEKEKQLFALLGAGGGTTINVGDKDDFNKQFDRGFKLSSQFKAEPIIKTFPEIQKSVDNMEAAFTSFEDDPSTFVAIDQALISSFNKILDPGSVVRESEFERTGRSLGLKQQIIGSLAKLAKGGAGLTNPDRLALVELARDLINKAQDRFDEKITEFELKAEQGRVPRDFVLGGIKRFTPLPILGDTPINPSSNPQSAIDKERLLLQAEKEAILNRSK